MIKNSTPTMRLSTAQPKIIAVERALALRVGLVLLQMILVLRLTILEVRVVALAAAAEVAPVAE